MNTDTYRPQTLRLCSLNICGIRDKVETHPFLVHYVQSFDLIWLSEVKTGLRVSVPGYVTYQNVNMEHSHRGGIVLLVKNMFVSFVSYVDMSAPSQIWIKLSCCQNLTFGGCYIPPADSTFYDPAIVGQVQARLQMSEELPILIGDLNARVWSQEALATLWPDSYGSYRNLADQTVNGQGRVILQLCADTDSVVVNHLSLPDRSYGGSLSFKKQEWISEIDLCIASKPAIPFISHLNINQNVRLPTDHAPVEVHIELVRCSPDMNATLARSEALGSHYVPEPPRILRGPPLCRVDQPAFRTLMENQAPPAINQYGDLNNLVTQLTSNMNAAAKTAKVHNSFEDVPIWDPQQDRWTRILRSNDHRTIWQSIGWNGSVRSDVSAMPRDDEFKAHFESLLNPRVPNSNTNDLASCPYIPVLDDPYTPHEVERAIKMTKDKAYIGACAGLFRLLPRQWIDFLTELFSAIFISATYPSSWCVNLLVLIFKSGTKLDCGNYRGISIMDSTAKVYDHLLNNRLSHWINVDASQAGAQKGRGCTEQIVALRLLVDYAMRKKNKLFLLYVDFKKAYDKVPRKKLFECLKARGCGKTMLGAIEAVYQDTKFMLHSAEIDASIGVRQGAPTSCLLFITYIDELSRMLAQHEDDGYLGRLHVMLLMDDTIIMATSRARLQSKLETLQNFCNNFGMEMNEKKTKLMVINGTPEDRAPLTSHGAVIQHADHYVYLGGHFTADGKMTTVMKRQSDACAKHVNKFAAFMSKNRNMPFSLKRKVFTAALSSAMLYSCESWLTDNLSSISKMYMAAVKMLLGVRTTTPNMICLLEIGLPELKSTVLKKQGDFLRKFRQRSSGDEPLAQILRLCENDGMAGMALRLQNAADSATDPVEASRENLRQMCRQKSEEGATRFETYMEINPSLTTHALYQDNATCVPDEHRIAATRMRLSSHRLRIESGRWSRIPRERRVCPCDFTSLQNESHVLLSCPLSAPIRDQFLPPLMSVSEFFDSLEPRLCALFCEKLLALFS